MGTVPDRVTMLRAVVNGIEQRVAPGTRILDLLGRLGIEVPSLCHDPRLRPTAMCRLCAVMVEGSSRPVVACATTAASNGCMRIGSGRSRCRRSRLCDSCSIHVVRAAANTSMIRKNLGESPVNHAPA